MRSPTSHSVVASQVVTSSELVTLANVFLASDGIPCPFCSAALRGNLANATGPRNPDPGPLTQTATIH
jgi:hypothetical protein